jgi:hypothetical protein
VHGLGATLELIERIPAADRPDTFAIYPSWWGDLPGFFGRRITEVPVHGNVICGGAEKVIYRADWRGLGGGGTPRSGTEGIVDELDVGDLVSEREHDYEFPHPGAGFVDFKLLVDPADPKRDLFDAGRRIPPRRSERFRIKTIAGKKTLLIARTAPEHDGDVEVRIDGKAIGAWHFERADGWREASIEISSERPTVDVTLTPLQLDWVDHHVWAVEAP